MLLNLEMLLKQEMLQNLEMQLIVMKNQTILLNKACYYRPECPNPKQFKAVLSRTSWRMAVANGSKPVQKVLPKR